jgi:hypothetical protein
MILFLRVVCLAIISGITGAQTVTVGQVISSPNNYSTLIVGNINLVLTVPHSGSIIVKGWPIRVDELGNIFRDTNTETLTMAVVKKLNQLFQQKFNTTKQILPFVVISNLHRFEYNYLSLFN